MFWSRRRWKSCCGRRPPPARSCYIPMKTRSTRRDVVRPEFQAGLQLQVMLEVNYICHFVLLEAALIAQAGALDRRFDGAQDHDLLLHLSEILKPGEIHHAPEVLYHWRKSAASTSAASAAAKPRAAKAGAAAVLAHFKRRQLRAAVVSRGGLTCNQVKWKPKIKKKQATVSILIPFRDHIEMTAECVAAIRNRTDDVEYEIILLDNWSTSPEAEALPRRRRTFRKQRS
jgi:O-antigen biosynthesis protein